MDEGKRLFCFGCGYSALVLAKRFVVRGLPVAGTCRTEEKAARLAHETLGLAAGLQERGGADLAHYLALPSCERLPRLADPVADTDATGAGTPSTHKP